MVVIATRRHNRLRRDCIILSSLLVDRTRTGYPTYVIPLCQQPGRMLLSDLLSTPRRILLVARIYRLGSVCRPRCTVSLVKGEYFSFLWEFPLYGKIGVERSQ